MKIIAFDIVGKFAHFRKFYANNSALSYSLPPRTTIIGILGAILGLEKESYYDIFSSDKIDIGIFNSSPIKKTFHRLNLLKIESLSADARGRQGHLQTPFEIISGFDVRYNLVRYTVYLRNLNLDNELYSELRDRILSRNPVFPVVLGLANFQATIEDPKELEAEEMLANSQELEFHSAVNSKSVEQIIFRQTEKYEFIEEETMPADFNQERRLTKMNDIVFTLGGIPLKIVFSGNYYKLENQKNICFLN